MNRRNKQTKKFASEINNKYEQVFLFSGHTIDRKNRPIPRFPEAMETEAHQKIEQILDRLKASAKDLAIAPGIACGGDILFLEACLRRKMTVIVFLPFEPAIFIEESVRYAGYRWVERFHNIKNHPQVTIELMSEHLLEVPLGKNPFERNNCWSLKSALTYGIEKLRLIVLWNGKGGDGPGGTKDMVMRIREKGGTLEHIDTTKFDYWQT